MEKIRVYSARQNGLRSLTVTIPALMCRAAHIEPGDDIAVYLDMPRRRLIIQKDKK